MAPVATTRRRRPPRRRIRHAASPTASAAARGSGDGENERERRCRPCARDARGDRGRAQVARVGSVASGSGGLRTRQSSCRAYRPRFFTVGTRPASQAACRACSSSTSCVRDSFSCAELHARAVAYNKASNPRRACLRRWVARAARAAAATAATTTRTPPPAAVAERATGACSASMSARTWCSMASAKAMAARQWQSPKCAADQKTVLGSRQPLASRSSAVIALHEAPYASVPGILSAAMGAALEHRESTAPCMKTGTALSMSANPNGTRLSPHAAEAKPQHHAHSSSRMANDRIFGAQYARRASPRVSHSRCHPYVGRSYRRHRQPMMATAAAVSQLRRSRSRTSWRDRRAALEGPPLRARRRLLGAVLCDPAFAAGRAAADDRRRALQLFSNNIISEDAAFLRRAQARCSPCSSAQHSCNRLGERARTGLRSRSAHDSRLARSR